MDSEKPSEAWIRPLRLWCGLILFAYLLTHFSNHALGLISLGTMEAARIWFLALWRNPVAESALFGALFAHWLLGLWLIFRRQTLRMPVWEATQIVFGLAVPPLLTYHLVGTRLTNAMFGTEDLYTRVILNLLVLDPWAGIRQWGLVTLAWTHGCIGIHFWLRFRRWYAPLFPSLLTASILVPVLAFLGVAEAGREVSALAEEPSFVQRLNAEVRAPSAVQGAMLDVSDPDCGRSDAPAKARPVGEPRARAHQCPAQCASCVPAPAEPGPCGDAATAGLGRCRRGARAPWCPGWGGAQDRSALRRSARVHAHGRAKAALRRRLHPQPLF